MDGFWGVVVRFLILIYMVCGSFLGAGMMDAFCHVFFPKTEDHGTWSGIPISLVFCALQDFILIALLRVYGYNLLDVHAEWAYFNIMTIVWSSLISLLLQGKIIHNKHKEYILMKEQRDILKEKINNCEDHFYQVLNMVIEAERDPDSQSTLYTRLALRNSGKFGDLYGKIPYDDEE